jgi:hypothetical protein
MGLDGGLRRWSFNSSGPIGSVAAAACEHLVGMPKIVDELIVELPLDRLEKLCFSLFDGWCERRNLIPLVYLLSAWPIVSPSVLATSRLLHALRELQQYHPEMLTPAEYRVVTQVLAIDVRRLEQDA